MKTKCPHQDYLSQTDLEETTVRGKNRVTENNERNISPAKK